MNLKKHKRSLDFLLIDLHFYGFIFNMPPPASLSDERLDMERAFHDEMFWDASGRLCNKVGKEGVPDSKAPFSFFRHGVKKIATFGGRVRPLSHKRFPFFFSSFLLF